MYYHNLEQKQKEEEKGKEDKTSWFIRYSCPLSFLSLSILKDSFLSRAYWSFCLHFEAIEISESQMLVTNASILPFQALEDLEFASSVELTPPTISAPSQLFDLTAWQQEAI